ncbi:MAG: hypothetical protein C0169_01075 [Thermodesulfobacterium geofontis]|uniref:Uncharacterized protein n=1 Tax=Thermodesulfobacterium geofontis TaxID=1295609 RepID=A0A2N7QGB5_9BACT|nr:MAG: hypothetical protein C0169_01075 [Thermodesulfobacterium geofontis]
MKRVLLIVLVILSFSLVFWKNSLSQDEERWQYIGNDVSGIEWYYDKASLNWLSDNIVEVWTKQIFTTEKAKKEMIKDLIDLGVPPAKAKKIYKTFALLEIDIKNQKYKILHIDCYDKKDNILYSVETFKISIPITPGGMDETLWEFMLLEKLNKILETENSD